LFEEVKDGAITVRGAEDDALGRQLMNGARKRVETAVGTCNGLARGLGHLRIDWAMSVATADEVEGWEEAVRRGGPTAAGGIPHASSWPAPGRSRPAASA